MISAGDRVMINPAYVVSMEWNYGPPTVLIIRMTDGRQHTVLHEPYRLGGTDATAVEKAIKEAVDKLARTP